MQRESIPELCESVCKIKTDAPPLPASPAAFWQRVDWSTLIPLTALLLHIPGAIWLLVLTVAYVQAFGWLATLPHAAFLPVYAFLAAYGGVRMQAGDMHTLYRCTVANALLAASY